MIPVAVGSQTNGSVIRPAAYCGVIGYKPTFGLISRHGVLAQSRRLDHVGVMARTLDDAALIAEVLIGFDGRDPDAPPRACPRLRAALAAAAGRRPRLALARTPYWERADPDARERIQRFAEQLGAETLVLPPAFEQAAEIHRVILEADLAHSFAREYERGPDALSAMLRSMIERGQQIRATEYQQALRAAAALQETLDAALAPFDAALTPATVGEAPLGLESTGSPLFCTIWTLCGTPALTLPALTGASGMPLGVQLVAPRHADARLFRAAQQVMAVGVSSS
jgi:Asp-tRNA(Asn)/Glu-tRNA(Gln) amidotransferase A subunit family amidase